MSSCIFLKLSILYEAVSFYLWCFRGLTKRGTLILGWWSSDGRQCWLWLWLGMLNRGREGLFELGQQLQQQGEYQAALHCFLSCLLGLTHVQSFTSLPNCLHQIAELFITEKNYGKALQFIQAEKMFYEVAMIELTALQGSTGPQEEATLGSAGWTTPEELSEQASQAQHLERLAQLCIMSKQPHLALEYSGKATKIHQRAFGNDHPITARSLELMATVYAEIGKTEYSDSLGQCVSALSKRFAADAESIRDTVNCLHHSHQEKHSDVRHRKDSHHQQDDTLRPKITNSKIPTSILKRPSSNYGSEPEPNHKRKGERRVRFREPETTVHDIPYCDYLGAYETTPSRPHLALFTCLFVLMSFLGVAMYCTDRRRPQRVCEELEAALAVYLLHMKQLLWGCWIWLTMQ
ncbi:nutritionally-regulated adipose and cardiac enriched protein homolog isoform X3 [Channa argus]|uniref:nutritionally-regulated adipose and cardiac enriched protein homolog isoform X3 n=1 Tax=Channa argus TaxID=215402 RepID=UPI0035220D28